MHHTTKAVLKTKSQKAEYLKSLTLLYTGYEKWQQLWTMQREMKENMLAGMPVKLDARKMSHIDHIFMTEVCGVCNTRDGPHDDETWAIDIACDVCLRWTHSKCTDASRTVSRLCESSVSLIQEDNVEFVCGVCRKTI